MSLRYIEHRRHTMRTKPGQHLSQAGVDLARRAGEQMGPFSRVVTSEAPRAFETSIAMGFAVDEQAALLSRSDFGGEFEFTEGFGRLATVVRVNEEGKAAQFARRLAAFHREIAESLGAGEGALLVSHGGIVEASAVGCVPDADFETWGPSCNYCEGIRLVFDGARFCEARLLRVAGTILLNE